jgi:hypothetical protein
MRRKKAVAAKKNGGVGVKNCQVQGKSTPIYRKWLGLGFLSGLGRAGMGLAQTLNRVALIYFHFILWCFGQTWIIGMLIMSRNSNDHVEFVYTQNRVN